MAWAYFDTSALIKRYVDEVGRSSVLRLLRRYDCVTSAVMPVELRSAWRRRVADGTLAAEQARELLQRLAIDRAFWALIDVSRDVLTAAETLVATQPLRTLDAIHVASAHLFKARVAATDLTFVTADTRQADAAAAIGIPIRRITST